MRSAPIIASVLAAIALAGCGDQSAGEKEDSADAACRAAVQQQVDVGSNDFLDVTVTVSGADAWQVTGTLREDNTRYRCDATWDNDAKQARAIATIG